MPIVHDSYKYKKRHSWSPITYILDIADYKIGWIFRGLSRGMLKREERRCSP